MNGSLKQKLSDLFGKGIDMFDSGVLIKERLFTRSEYGYHSFRIPGLQVCPNNHILVFVEGRKDTISDFGNIDLVLRRSEDGGHTWEEPQILSQMGKSANQNPCPIYDRDTKEIHLFFIVDRKKPYYMKSGDFGKSWSEPRFLENLFNPAYTVNGSSPGHGIQLQSGRLLIPGIYNEGEVVEDGHPADGGVWNSLVIISDDHGKTWQFGAQLQELTNESLAVELADGRIKLIMRQNEKNSILEATSSDEGMTFAKASPMPDVISPICQASIARIPTPNQPSTSWLLFSNPNHPRWRHYLTIKVSKDGGNSWPISKLLYRRRAAYSDVAIHPEGKMYCVFEGGKKWANQHIYFTCFSKKWLGL